MKPRRIPIRTCAGCRQERAKREMVRVVRSLDGSVAADPTGKRAGRGTYVCPQFDCWRKAFRAGSLTRVLKTEIRESDLAELRRFAEQFQSASGEIRHARPETPSSG